MSIYIKLYAIALPVFFIIDMVWLGLVAKNFYRHQIGYLLKENANWPAAIIFYILFLAGLTFFVISPAVERQSWQYVILVGAFFGLVTYATYDLTNLALTKNWPVFVTVVDLAWGMVLSSLVAFITYLIYQKI